MTAYIIKKNWTEDEDSQNTDIYDYGNDDYTLDNDDLLCEICWKAINDINFVARAEWGTSFINNKVYAYGYENIEKIDEIVDRCIDKTVEKLTIAECEAIIAERGIYEAFEIARKQDCDFMDLRKDKDWRCVIYALIKSQLRFAYWIKEVSADEFNEIDDDLD